MIVKGRNREDEARGGREEADRAIYLYMYTLVLLMVNVISC